MFTRTVLTAAVFCTVVLSHAWGNIPIEDPGQYWDKGIIDPEIEGHWQRDMGMSHKRLLSFVREGGHYIEEGRFSGLSRMSDAPSGDRVKTLVLGKHKFLIYDGAGFLNRIYSSGSSRASGFDKVKGRLVKYELKGESLIRYNLHGKVLSDAIEKGHVTGTLPDEKARMFIPAILKLDEETIQFLQSLKFKGGRYV